MGSCFSSPQRASDTHERADPPPLLLVAPTYPEYAVVSRAVADLLMTKGLEARAFGMGLASANVLCQSLAEKVPALGGLVLVGWAGGLDPDLTAGDIVLADAAMNTAGGRVPCTVIELAEARVGPVLTVPEPLYTVEAKAALAHHGALAAEMEAYPIAAWAQACGLPFIHVRVILDAAEDPLPDLGEALDLLGRVRWRQLARRVMVEPSLAVDLLRLVRRVRALSPVLGRVSRDVAEALQESVTR